MKSFRGLLVILTLVASNAANNLRERIEIRSRHDTDRELVVGGAAIVNGDYEWYARMESGTAICGGALIDPDHVLTSAKCITEVFGSAGPSTGRVGILNDVTNSILFNVACTVLHPQYSNAGAVPINDIALLKLSASVSGVTPLLGNVQSTYPDASSALFFMGFGATMAGSTALSDTLQNVSLPFVDLATCNPFYSNALGLQHLCAGGVIGKGACNSDEGGPLVGYKPPMGLADYAAVGIYSTSSSNCGANNAPDLFTNVAFFAQSWIEPELMKACPPTAPPTPFPTPAPTSATCCATVVGFFRRVFQVQPQGEDFL